MKTWQRIPWVSKLLRASGAAKASMGPGHAIVAALQYAVDEERSKRQDAQHLAAPIRAADARVKRAGNAIASAATTTEERKRDLDLANKAHADACPASA